MQALSFTDKIKFDHVGFRYPDSSIDVLENINFEIRKGETVGFIGSSGSGKTTLLNIFYVLLLKDKEVYI